MGLGGRFNCLEDGGAGTMWGWGKLKCLEDGGVGSMWGSPQGEIEIRAVELHHDYTYCISNTNTIN